MATTTTNINPYKPMPVTTTYGEDYHLTTAYQIRQARKGDQAAIDAFRASVAKKAYRQNARYRNLERAGLAEHSGAYKATLKFLGVQDKPSYSVTRKLSVQELVRLNSHLDRIDSMGTNSIRALRQTNARRAKAIGLKFRTQRELDYLYPKFFELDQKLQEYLRLAESSALWRYADRHEAIITYLEENKIDLSDPSQSIDIIVERIANAAARLPQPTSPADGDLFDFFGD